MNGAAAAGRSAASTYASTVEACEAAGITAALTALHLCRRVFKLSLPWPVALVVPAPSARRLSVARHTRVVVYTACRGTCRGPVACSGPLQALIRGGQHYSFASAGEGLLVDVAYELARSRLVLAEPPRGAFRVVVEGPEVVAGFARFAQPLRGVLVVDEPSLVLVPLAPGSRRGIVLAREEDALGVVEASLEGVLRVGSPGAHGGCSLQPSPHELAVRGCDPYTAVARVAGWSEPRDATEAGSLSALTWVFA